MSLPMVVEPQAFDMERYLADVHTPMHMAQSKALLAAYDVAVSQLVGPNDVQVEGARSFKKKSAWRKLARYFRISVECTLDDVRIERHELGFTAYATATANAPWGQSWSDVGACASDEATGRRTITEADAVATAMTRAGNRAVSNLIAMGEVSAEELGRRAPSGPPRARAISQGEPAKVVVGSASRTELAGVPSGAITPVIAHGERVERPPVSSAGATKTTTHAGTTDLGELTCAKCGGVEFYDNRRDKKTPRHPDFRCKNCREGIWLDSRAPAVVITTPDQDAERMRQWQARMQGSAQSETAPPPGYEDFPDALREEEDDLPF